MQGGHPPPDEHGLAWSPREWHLAPDTMALARFGAPAEPSNGGDAIQQPAHAKNGVGRPPKTSRQAGPGSGSGAAGAKGGSGAPREAERRAPQAKITRTCSAEGCSNAIPDRRQGAVLMCSQHRRATTGVLVRDCPELMRWCYHCKKPHGLSAFADSRIGKFRKLATCEYGILMRNVSTANKLAAKGNPPAKGKRRSASHDDPVTTTTPATGFFASIGLFPSLPARTGPLSSSQPSSPHPPPASNLQPGAWHRRELSRVALEVSVPIHPSAVADSGQRPFDVVMQLVSEAFRDGAEREGAGVHDDNMPGSGSSWGSHQTLPGEGEGDATLEPDLFSDPNLIFPSLGPVEEMLDAAQPLDVAPSSFVDFILDSTEAAILPGSVRLHVTSCVLTPHERTSAHLEVEALCQAVPREGVFGARAVTVSVMSDALLGHGWKTPSAGGGAGSSASASASGSGSRSSGGRVVTFDAETRVSSAPLPMTPFPEWVRVPPVAVLGRHFHVRGLRGGETVHVFGQNMRPYSVVIPNGVGDRSLRVATLAPADELGGIPGDHPVVPGFLQVQVLRPGQPAAGAECVNILLAEDDATALELDALRRGAGDGARSILGVDDTCRELIEDAGLNAPLAPIAGFVSESAFERFAGDFAQMVELHWRSRLYHPSARDAARRVMSLAAQVFDRERAPAISGALENIVDDVDAQEEAEAEVEEMRPGGVFRLLKRIGVPVGEDELGGHQDKCTGSRVYEAVPGSARRVDAVDSGRFRRFFAMLREDETAAEAEEMTKTSGISFGIRAGLRRFFVLPLDDHCYPVSTSTYIEEHIRCSRLLLTLVFQCVLRAHAWRVKPSDIALSYAFVLALYWVPFEAGSRIRLAREAIARLRERVVGAGLDGAYEALVTAVLQLSNGIVRALVFNEPNPIGSAPDSRWIIVVACAIVNLTIYAIFTAEIALPSRKRVDVLVLGAVSFAALTFPCLVIAPEEAARQGMFAPHGSVWSAAAWLFLLPVACATAARRAYRAAIRSRGHSRAFESRLETAAEAEKKTDMADDVYPIPTSTYIDAHRRLSTVYFVLVILGVLRAPDWGVKPSDIAIVEVPLLVLYCAPFAVGSRFGLAREAIARLRERVVGAGLDGAYEALLAVLLAVANGMDYGLILFGTNPPTGSAPDSRWIIASACATVNLTVYALFTAEAAPPSRKRADVLVMGAVSFVTMMVGCHIVCPEAMRMHQKGMFAPFGSVWSAAAWLFLLPVACATAARRAYRASVRLVIAGRKLE